MQNSKKIKQQNL